MDRDDDRMLVAVDNLKESDNVLILLRHGVAVATVPPSQANRLANADRGEQIVHPHWIIPIDDLEVVQQTVGDLKLEFTGANGRPATILHRTTADAAAELKSAIQRDSPDSWLEERGRESGIKSFIACLGGAIVIAALTALFYFAIKSGTINTAPTFIATIYNLLGLNGILAAGGLLTLLCLGIGIKSMIAPAEIVTIRRR